MFDWLTTFFDVRGAAAHVVHLLQTEGATALDGVRQALAAIKAVTGRDFPAVFSALAKEQADVQEIIAAVKAEFGLG